MMRLRAYRHLEIATQEDLAVLLGTTPQAVSSAEAGRRPLSADVSGTGYSLERFSCLPSMTEPLHRQRASTLVANTKRAKELLRLGGEVFLELSSRVERSPKMALDRIGPPMSLTNVEELAQEVRCGVLDQEETNPIRNLTSAVERAGICLVPIAGLTGIDGLSSWVDGQPVIGLDPTVPGDRFRFSMLHELGHLSMHRTKSDITEDEANRFAGAVLIPEAELEAALDSRMAPLRDFVHLKQRWGVSVAALVYRSRELGLIDDNRFRSLQIQMSKWRRQEPESFDAIPGGLLPKLVELAGGPERVGKQMGIKPSHIRELINWSRLRVV